MITKFVYHASKVGGLKVLEPKPSTHKKKWVYATKDIATAAMFLGENFDFICQTGLENGKPYIYEQFKGAFKEAYSGQKGSIYKLDTSGFKENQTSFSGEVVFGKPAKVIEEIKIPDALKYLEKFKKEGKIKIYKFPHKPKGAPHDKSDIIEKAVVWTKDFGEDILEQVKKYHPDVLSDVKKRLKV